ncbi:unnamed protein product [Arctia plantaginis]|uniref:Uncharacterized protein n=1 Tax=Arctia plantaginis TaxID=874455 RepID=A0A8S1A266_ARCPL|nr:unnamed protein product [Arctia plantaginis]
MFTLFLLPLAHHDTLDDRALFGREVREVRHVSHGGRRQAATGARARRVLRCYARGARLCAPLWPEVYLIMPGGPMARTRLLTSAQVLIETGGRVRATGLTERLGELRGTTYMRAHINYAAIYVHNPLSSTAANIELLTSRPYLKMAWDYNKL